ncbi:MAG: hypothetical protein LKJ83_05125 [Eubacteriaceae bacterium]|jgi:pyocin large subunit-like protein|nr:hypothetical protein [Eubacteriaceae bacterium]
MFQRTSKNAVMAKRLFALLMCVLVVFAFAACGSSDPGSGSSYVSTESTADGSQFRSRALLDSHYEKHVQDQDEFGSITRDEYLKMAQNLVDHPGKSVLTKQDSDGNTLYYDKDNNTFAVKSSDGYIRTFFKPQDGIDYYDRQT